MGLQPVDSVRLPNAGQTAQASPSNASQSAPAMSNTQSSSAAIMSSSTSTTTSSMFIDARVGEFLGSIGGELQSDQQLRMIIGLLILQALLSGDRQEGDVQGGELMNATLLAGMLHEQRDVGIISETNIVQIHQQSSLVMTDHAVQTLAGDGSNIGGENSPGSRLDVSG